MKTTLKASLVLNAGLVACLLYFSANRPQLKNIPRGPATAKAAQVAMPAQTIAATMPSREAPEPLSEPGPFQWGQLESASDYRVYIKNLRAIGCPKQTLRDIVSGNVDRAFSVERQKLSLDGNEPGPWSYVMETRFIDDLLGEAGDSTPAEVAQVQISYPLVLQKVNLDALGLTDEQKQVIAQLQQQFIDNVGGPYQDPNDPAYLERWEKSAA